jgi:large conductance mechanosensitive channel
LDFANYYWPLSGQAANLSLAEAKKLGAVFAYGNFITVALNFCILAFVIFVMVRQINRLKSRQPAETAPPKAPEPAEEVLLLREIRDSLKRQA